MKLTTYHTHVKPEEVDYNGHMNDAVYAAVFSEAVDDLMSQIGLTKDFIRAESHTLYTLETHLCYLKEAHQGEALTVRVKLIDYDKKRLHVLFIMTNQKDERIATSEQMLMGIDQTIGRPAPFLPTIREAIDAIWHEQPSGVGCEQVGRTIGIKRKA
ncbi:acyl-CoA thioester hydrolase [Pelagirhabdus alkalitolerans]|uniref:Acyl-CoA thioester hydrolase n=1 Tax=Pelagirhabdus alkalitolerans TaxID=1612202 RepID=A0A1G6JRG6_9BACI|nr:thioesterase family protein [Pelagirhabdus alkalitolerans]SDC21293.1 acyl-CoA thioester hydrolase [Pelagirhabdus alkalitolerans]